MSQVYVGSKLVSCDLASFSGSIDTSVIKTMLANFELTIEN